MTTHERTIELEGPFDFFGTLSPIRMGGLDPTCRLDASSFVRATDTPEGPATLALTVEGHRILARAFGPGAAHMLDTLDAHLGLDDDPRTFVPDGPKRLVTMARRNPGLKCIRLPSVFHTLVQVVLQQRVRWRDATRSYRRLVERHGRPAPGPFDLMLPPDPETFATLPDYAFREVNVEGKRADTIRRTARSARRVEETLAMTHADADKRLSAFRGMGPWSSAFVRCTALGDPDAVPVGDLWIPHQVAWMLAGERRGSDERMLALLEPYRPHRWRVVRLLMKGQSGPRLSP